MKIMITTRELIDKELWDKFCEVTGTNEYSLSEGLVVDTDEFILTEEEAKKIGLLEDDLE